MQKPVPGDVWKDLFPQRASLAGLCYKNNYEHAGVCSLVCRHSSDGMDGWNIQSLSLGPGTITSRAGGASAAVEESTGPVPIRPAQYFHHCCSS